MDEQRISALFQDAVRDTPAPTFDAGDVTTESARLTRKRNGLLAGSALGFAVLVGGAATGVALWSGPNGGSGNDTAAVASGSAPEANETAAPYEVPDDGARDRADTPTDLPGATPKQGGSTFGSAGSDPGGTPSGCGTAAGEFAAALAGELPAATSHGDPVPSPLGCPPDSQSVALPVSDGARQGLLSLLVVPAEVRFVAPPWHDRPEGTLGAMATADSGRQIYVVIEPVAGTVPPLEARQLAAIADGLRSEF